jgi:uncharacterized protein (DUF433 family)
MASPREFEDVLGKLSSAEKTQVLKSLRQNLGDKFPGIESRPDVGGGEACIVGTRIPVWLLESARRQGVAEQVPLAAYPTLRAEDRVNAWNYARAHATEIDGQDARQRDGLVARFYSNENIMR